MRTMAALASTTTADTYPSNTALYQDPNLVETVDYARRHRRHELFDDGLPHHCAVAQTTIIAPPGDAEAVLVGGRNATLKQYLLDEFAVVKLHAIDAAGHPNLDGSDPDNIANRTLLGMGGHLELTGPLRSAMFGVNSRPQRKDTTTEVFWDFAAACRNALARLEVGQVIL